MGADKKLHNVTKEVLSFVAYKVNIINKLPVVAVPSISTELVENLRMTVWVERYVAIEDSKKFMLKHLRRMTATPQLYTTYVIYACHLVKKSFEDPYEVFVRTLALVVQMALYSMPKQLPELLGWSLAIFTNFFEGQLIKDFYDRGGWEKLNKYLLSMNSLKMYRDVDLLESQGKLPDEIAELLNVETTLLGEYLSKDVTESDIKSHGPTVFIWEMVQTTGFNAGSHFMCQLMESQAVTDCEINLNESPATSRHSTDGASVSSVIGNMDSKGNVKHVQPAVRSGITNRIAYCQAKESLRDLQIDCLRVEQLLDIIFGDYSED